MSDVSSTILENIRKYLLVKSYVTGASNTLNPTALSAVSRMTSVEPFCVISKDCANLEYIQDVNNTLLNMFVSYYLQAVTCLVKLGNIKVRKLLNSVGTNYSSMILESQSLNQDILKFKLPNSKSISMEASANGDGPANLAFTKGDSLPDLQSNANLAVGKIIELEITGVDQIIRQNKTKTTYDNETSSTDQYKNDTGEILVDDEGNRIPDTHSDSNRQRSSDTNEEQLFYKDGKVTTIPIMVRFLVNVVPTRTIESLLVRYKQDISFTERWFSWRAGRIRFWRDLVFCQDLIKEHKKTILDSDNQVVRDIDNRVNEAVTSKVGHIAIKAATDQFKDLSQIDTYSFGVASNLYVITATEAAKIEYFLHGKLSDIRVRNKLFGNGYAMILTVIDPDRERVKFYINGADGYTDLSVKEIKSMAKNKGPDIGDMLKMLQMGMSPTF